MFSTGNGRNSDRVSPVRAVNATDIRPAYRIRCSGSTDAWRVVAGAGSICPKMQFMPLHHG